MKTWVVNCLIALMKDGPGDRSLKRLMGTWFQSLTMYIVFTRVVQKVYVTQADRMLRAMMDPTQLIRSEQFMLSVLIHYPNYILLAILAGLIALWGLCISYFCIDWLNFLLYRRLTRHLAARQNVSPQPLCCVKEANDD